MNREDREYLIERLFSERRRWENPKHPVYQAVNSILRKINSEDWSFSREEFLKCFTSHTPKPEQENCLEIYERNRTSTAGT